jgi:hypothetical protein
MPGYRMLWINRLKKTFDYKLSGFERSVPGLEDRSVLNNLL